MATKNTEEKNLPDTDQVLMNEDDMLKGVLEAADFKKDPKNRKLIQIKRRGKLLFQFHVRPLEENELNSCRKRATKYIPNPQNRHLRIEADTDYVKLRSIKIYMATVDEERKKLWDNPRLCEKFNTIEGFEVIDKVLMAGEKDQICDVIDDISGYNESLEETAKNLSMPEENLIS